MKRYIHLVIFITFLAACSSPKKGKEESKTEEAEMSEPAQPIGGPSQDSEGDEYKIVLKYIDNRAIVYMNDSIVYD